ncbi:MAG: hypothetical protein JHC95_08640 [Solirubrobacteraceae bacterium]|nr:hypothetical protein [Solirubrobacteraceae bacterium]
MELVLAWLVFPIVTIGVCAGLGLLLQWASGAALPVPLLPGAGLAVLVVVSQLTTTRPWAAPATVPVLAVLAVAGYVVERKRLRGLRPGRWAVLAGVVTLAIAAAPVVLSGQATFSGYTVLADLSIHLMGADAMLDHGRDFSLLEPSTYQGALVSYYNGSAYPAGGATALGTLARLSGEDAAWAVAPFLALLVALLALAFYELAGTVLRPGPVRAIVATVAAQPAIVYTYALQGSLKEIGAVSLVGLLAALCPWYVDRRREGGGPRAVVALAVVTAAACAVVGAVALTWTGPLLVAALLIGTRAAPARRTADAWVSGGVLVVVLAALSIQTISGLATYLEVTNQGRTPEARAGNLKSPLKPTQVAGVWLTGDHRDVPDGARKPLTSVLQILVALAAAGGVVLLARRRVWWPLLLLATMIVATIVLVWQGTPWSDAKAYMIASPAVLFCALLGAALLLRAHGVARVAGVGVGGAIVLGVLASNALAYREVSLAPRDRMDELAAINERFAGQGPALTPEYEEFGKYFLRDIAPEGPVEGWRSRDVELAHPEDPPNLLGTSVELGELADPYVRHYPLLVLRRGFAMSRPPVGYRRVFEGRWYDVWRREGEQPRVVDTLALGRDRQAAAVPSCAHLQRLARSASAAGGELAFVARSRTPMFEPGRVRHAWNWVTDSGDPSLVNLFGPGRSRGSLVVDRPGRYDVWVEARVGRPVEVRIDGRPVGRVGWRMNPRMSPERVAQINLQAGRHSAEVLVGGGGLRPGAAGNNRIVGPVGLTETDPATLPVGRVSPARWRELCGRRYDWVAAVAQGR